MSCITKTSNRAEKTGKAHVAVCFLFFLKWVFL